MRHAIFLSATVTEDSGPSQLREKKRWFVMVGTEHCALSSLIQRLTMWRADYRAQIRGRHT